MGRAPCCDKANVKKGPWSPEEDAQLKEFIEKHGTGGNWIALPHKAGLKRCGKSCRLRWLNYLRPNIKHGEFSEEEDRIIFSLFANIGSRWSIIAAQLPGRTDNDIKNYWNTKLKKKLLGISTSSQRKTQQRHHPPPPPPPSSQQHHDQQLFNPSSVDSTITTLQASPPSATCSSYTASMTQKGALPPGMEGIIPLGADILGMVAAAGSLLPTPPAVAHHYPMKEYSCSNSSGFLMFGGEQQSCSSSDASCPQIGYVGREMEYELGVEDLFYGGGMGDDAHEKLFYVGGPAAVGAAHQMAKAGGGCNNIWGYEAPVDYAALEDIKQLIAAPGTTGCNNPLFSGDDVPGGAIMGSRRSQSAGTTTGLIS